MLSSRFYKMQSERYGSHSCFLLVQLSEHGVLLCDTPVLFTREPEPLILSPSSILSIILSSSSILIMLYFRPSRLHPPPPPVLLQPRPSTLSSSTHPLHPSRGCPLTTLARSETVSVAVDRFAAAAAAAGRTLPVVAATLLLLLHPLLYLFIFFQGTASK